MEANLKHLNPRQVLERGYSITESSAGVIIRDVARLETDETVTITFAKGQAGAQIKRRIPD